jgi:hypothetical protein
LEEFSLQVGQFDFGYLLILSAGAADHRALQPLLRQTNI